jgi:hypothetical protein
VRKGQRAQTGTESSRSVTHNAKGDPKAALRVTI